MSAMGKGARAGREGREGRGGLGNRGEGVGWDGGSRQRLRAACRYWWRMETWRGRGGMPCAGVRARRRRVWQGRMGAEFAVTEEFVGVMGGERCFLDWFCELGCGRVWG